ncbi:proteasome assembly chaperone 1 isoform X1 [Sceloporus undulatus]|uniref:proteasome assembly chaperone 1 isoform X1 n=1 Tax=Sceloporus undulatus TaxID=8520 RepID=UPI001C4D54F2|nr:proteasome assembly chaperone 1 isoform X1 [Sceloporus undulatus]
MATFFGEVVALPSRAGLEEEEEEEAQEDCHIRLALEGKRKVDVVWNTTLNASTEEQFPCSKFILAVGQNAVAFLSSFVLSSGCWEVVGSVKLWNEWSRTSDRTNVLPTDSFCLFYRLISDPTILLCQCNCYVAEDQQFQWLEKEGRDRDRTMTSHPLYDHLQCLQVFGCMQKIDLQVLVLSSCSITDYKTTESILTLPSPFLKAVKTTAFKDQVCCSLLEQPNIVRDLPAAVLSYCQVWQIPAVFYQCYTDILKLDLVTVEVFQPVLSSKILKSLVKDISRSTELLTKLVTTNEIHNIYT